MKIKRQLCPAKRNTAVALGFFDGVHVGHQAVLQQTVCCKADALVPAAFTFMKSPQAQLHKKAAPALLTMQQKEALFAESGIELLYTVDFRQVMPLSPYDFVKQVLMDTLHAKKVLCGFNYHFGSGGKADAHILSEICREFFIEVVPVPPVLYKDAPVSSTRIRKALMQGDIDDATQMLGRPFAFDFAVQKGNQLGRRLHTPTFNQPFPAGFVLPRFGVYATAVCLEDGLRCGVTNIGMRPTVGAVSPLAETWMPQDACGELYGKKIEVRLLAFLRDEKKFESLEQLQSAILKDGCRAQHVFAQYMEKKPGK